MALYSAGATGACRHDCQDPSPRLPANGYTLLVQTYFQASVATAPSIPNPATQAEPIAKWPYLDQAILRSSCSQKVCMTCHWFRHYDVPSDIPLLSCQLHQGLIAQGKHLDHRCTSWIKDMVRQQGWEPEVA